MSSIPKDILFKNRNGQAEPQQSSSTTTVEAAPVEASEPAAFNVQHEIHNLKQRVGELTQNASQKMNEIALTPAVEGFKVNLNKLWKGAKNPTPATLLTGLAILLLTPALFTLLGGAAILKSMPSLPRDFPNMHNMIPSVFKDASQAHSPMHEQQAWIKSLFPFLDSSTISASPRILRTPKSYNIIYELPGFTASDLDITTDEDNIYIDGHTSCKDLLEGVGLEKDFDAINRSGLCYEKRISVQTTIPRTMENYGDIHAFLKNGILRISIPTEKDTSMSKRVIELFSDLGHRMTHPLESIKPVIHRAKKDSNEFMEGTRTKAGDYAEYGQEKVNDYIIKPVKDTMHEGSDQIQRGSEKVGEYAQKGKDAVSGVVSDIDRATRDAIQAAEDNLAELRRKASTKQQHQDNLKQIPVEN